MLKVGQNLTLKRTLTQKDFDRFAALSGDNNPIHVDPHFAARTKFGATVAHGMLLYSLLYLAVDTLISRPGWAQLTQSLKFPTPTYAGEEVTIQVAVCKKPSPETAEIKGELTRPSGEIGCEGKTLVWLPGSVVDFSPSAYQPPVYEGVIQSHRGLKLGDSAAAGRTFSETDVRAYWQLISKESQQPSQRQPFILGPLLGGMISDLLGTHLPGRGTNWLKQRFHFYAPVRSNEPLAARVKVIRLRPEKDLVNLRTTVTKNGGETAVDGEALVWVNDLEER